MLGFFRTGTLMLLTLLLAVGSAMAAPNWGVLETDHFLIYSLPEHKAIAGKLAEIAEEVYPKVTKWVGHTPTDRTHVILLDTSDLPNGMASPFYYSRIVVFPVFPGNSIAYPSGLSSRFEDSMRSLFIHEYTHIVQLDMNDGVSSTVRAIFGRVPLISTPNMMQPPMGIEGLAVTAETELTSAGRGRDPYYDMFLRTAVLNNKLLRLDQTLGFYLDRWDPAGAPYLYGASFMNYLSEKYGLEKVQEINERFSRGAIIYGDVVQKSLGVTLNEAWAGWEQDIRARYTKQADVIQANELTQLTMLANKGDLAIHPAFSPDGRYVAYGATSGAVNSLRLIDTQTGVDKQLSVADTLLTGNISWSPGGTRLVYSRFNDDSPTRTFSDIYLYDVKSGKETRLTRGLRAYSPTYSPDGKGIMFISRPTPMDSQLMVMAGDGGIATEIKLKGPDGLVLLSVEYAPDRRGLAISGWLPGGYTDLYKADLQTRLMEPITNDRAVDENPTWTADGRYVLYDSDLSGVYNVYAYDTQTGRHFKVTNVLSGAFAPSVSAAVPQVVAMDYTADGYKLAVFTYDPVQWQAVERGKEPMLVASTETAKSENSKSPVTRSYSYSPLATMRPTYWLPSYSEDNEGTRVGIFTSGEDVLGSIRYNANVGYHFGIMKPSFDVQTQYTFGKKDQWLLGIRAAQAMDATSKTNQPVRAEASVDLGYVWGGARNLKTISLIYNPVQTENAFGEPNAVEDHVAATLRISNAGGSGYRKLATDTLFRVAQDLGADKGSAMLLRRNVATTRTSRFVLDTAVGVAENTGVLTTGGHTLGFGLRGIKPQDAGIRVAGASIQFDKRYPIERGRGDWPLFLSEVTVGPFVDAAWTNGLATGERTDASIGVELGLGAYVGYYGALDLRLGMAKPVTGMAKSPTLYVGGRLPF